MPPKKCANLFVGIIVPSFVILLYFLFPYISPYATVYLDTLLGAYFGACVILILKFKDLTYRNILLHIINIAALMQVKDISIVLALLCIFILFIRYFFLKREKILCKKTVLFIGGIFLGLFWWKIILLLTNKREDQFSNLQLGDFLNGLMNFGKNGNYFSDVFYAFIDAFINRSIMLGGISTIYIAILLGILSLIIVFKEEDLYHKLAVSLFPLFFIGYCLILLVVYEIAMSPSEALAVNSYERYISTFFIAWMILIVYEYLRIIKKLTIFKCCLLYTSNEACIESIRASDWDGEILIFCVDNDSQDGSPARLEECYGDEVWFHLIRMGKNTGFATANNRGLHEAVRAGCDCLMLLNNDTCIRKDMIRKLVAGALSVQGKACIVAPKIYYWDHKDTIWSAGGYLTSIVKKPVSRGERCV